MSEIDLQSILHNYKQNSLLKHQAQVDAQFQMLGGKFDIVFSTSRFIFQTVKYFFVIILLLTAFFIYFFAKEFGDDSHDIVMLMSAIFTIAAFALYYA
jgi:predicted lactoylglutathione lyase